MNDPAGARRPTRSWDVPLSLDGLASIEQEVQDFLDDHLLDPHALFVTRLVIEEVVANLAQHGAGGQSARATVEIALTADASQVTIVDDEEAFDPRSAPALDTAADLDHRRPGGMGLHLVRELTDSLRYERVDGRNRLVALVRRADGADPS